jgi:hypothetical protein
VTISPGRQETIVDMEFIRGEGRTIPVVLAVTAELP